MVPHRPQIDGLADRLFREEAGRLTAVLIRLFGFSESDLIEDIVQDAFLAALKTWRIKGVPENPSAWLMQVAKNRALNELKRNQKSLPFGSEALPAGSGNGREVDMDRFFLDDEIRDSRLRLIFACCDPGLPSKSRIILSLRTLCGFGIQEIASALVMKSEAVKKNLYRARRELKKRGDLPVVPLKKRAAERMSDVLKVVYLLFNEGYQSSTGPNLIREELCLEAIRLAKELLGLPPAFRGEVHALLSLFYFSMSRFDARESPAGDILDLEEQDRSLWDQTLIRIAFSHLKQSRTSEKVGRYHLEASVSSIHAASETFGETDWKTIVYYYNRLIRFDGSPVTQISRAIAIGHAEGADYGLDTLNNLERSGQFVENHIYHAAKGYLFSRRGDFESAMDHYKCAMALTDSARERRYFEERVSVSRKKMDRI
jgi:RNA polymerase sigma-70 factor (ECF subfamily)